MAGALLEVSVAVGLLILELSEEPWKGKLITFGEKPRLISVEEYKNLVNHLRLSGKSTTSPITSVGATTNAGVVSRGGPGGAGVGANRVRWDHTLDHLPRRLPSAVTGEG
ncbi:hypothetical protein RJ639_021387 [Escallonia herrerae]|uniref:DUF7788 domain-containing protein n=1 Tax=Escallonia herrerae TaxID=1293975 RepID=A0AA88V1Z6_9ASTE|nr:hypothetical protein RJ639_021387 [Escallonia herrerae]